MMLQTRWIGLDGLRGPILSGTGFYARRDALYGATPVATSSPIQGAYLLSATATATCWIFWFDLGQPMN
jgi:hypothetical protein